jgi:hypothetical protein
MGYSESGNFQTNVTKKPRTFLGKVIKQQLDFTAATAKPVGQIAGTVIGGVVGGPAGAAIGSKIGGVAGGLVSKGAGAISQDSWHQTQPNTQYKGIGEGFQTVADIGGSVIGGMSGGMGGGASTALPQGASANYTQPTMQMPQMGMPQSPMTNESSMMMAAYGGNIPQVQMYNRGGSHEQNSMGGIPVDSYGNPSMNPSALVEQNEVGYKLPNDKSGYVFSDRINYPGKKSSFSSEAKRVMGKYKNRLGKELDRPDALAKQSLDREIEELKNKQELVKQVEQQQTAIKAYGGYLKKLAMGGLPELAGDGTSTIPPAPAVPMVGAAREVDPNTLAPWQKVEAKMTEYANVLGNQLPAQGKEDIKNLRKQAVMPIIGNTKLKGTERGQALFDAKAKAATEYGMLHPDFYTDPKKQSWGDDFYSTREAWEKIQANKGIDANLTQGTLEQEYKDLYGARNEMFKPAGVLSQREVNGQLLTDSLGYNANDGKYTMYTKSLKKGSVGKPTGINPNELNQGIDPTTLKSIPTTRYKSATATSELVSPKSGVGSAWQAYGGPIKELYSDDNGLRQYSGKEDFSSFLPTLNFNSKIPLKLQEDYQRIMGIKLNIPNSMNINRFVYPFGSNKGWGGVDLGTLKGSGDVKAAPTPAQASAPSPVITNNGMPVSPEESRNNFLKGQGLAGGWKNMATGPYAGYALQAATRLPQLFTKANNVQYDRVNAQNVDYGQERAAMEGSRNAQLGMLKRQASMAGSAGQAMNYLGSAVPSAYNTYDQNYAQSLERQQNTNAQYQNQASAQNAQISMREAEANAQEQDAARGIRDQALSDLGNIGYKAMTTKRDAINQYNNIMAFGQNKDYGMYWNQDGAPMQYYTKENTPVAPQGNVQQGAQVSGQEFNPMQAKEAAYIQMLQQQRQPLPLPNRGNQQVALGGNESYEQSVIPFLQQQNTDFSNPYAQVPIDYANMMGNTPKKCKGGYLKKKGRK